MLVRDDLPELGADLVAALAALHVDDLAHFGVWLWLRKRGDFCANTRLCVSGGEGAVRFRICQLLGGYYSSRHLQLDLNSVVPHEAGCSHLAIVAGVSDLMPLHDCYKSLSSPCLTSVGAHCSQSPCLFARMCVTK